MNGGLGLVPIWRGDALEWNGIGQGLSLSESVWRAHYKPVGFVRVTILRTGASPVPTKWGEVRFV